MLRALFAMVVMLSSVGCTTLREERAVGRIEAYLGPTFDEIIVEVDHAPGHAPSTFAMDALRAALIEATGKRVRMLDANASDALSRDVWSPADVDGVGRAHLSAAPPRRSDDGRAAVLHILYLEGAYRSPDGEDALGIATEERAALFFDRDVVAPMAPPEKDGAHDLERAVLIHEVGHLLGLVDNGVPMSRPHADPESPVHSKNRESVMYRAVDAGRALLSTLDLDELPYRFDEDDMRDLDEHRRRLAGEL